MKPKYVVWWYEYPYKGQSVIKKIVFDTKKAGQDYINEQMAGIYHLDSISKYIREHNNPREFLIFIRIKKSIFFVDNL